MIGRTKLVRYGSLAVVVVFLSVAQFRSTIFSFGSNLGPQIHAAQGVVDGLPHWRIYQSRVLGPYMVQGAKILTNRSYEQAYKLMIFVWLALFFTILIAVSLSLWHSPFIAAGIAASAAFLNTTLMQGMWLYAWDYIDLILFTLLTWAVLRNKSLKVIALIVVVEIFNREAATIVAGWVVLDALLDLVLRRKTATSGQLKSAKQQLLVGIALVIICQVTTEVLRATLLIREVGPEIFHDVKQTGTFFEIQLWKNLYRLGITMSRVTSLMLAFNIILIAIPVLCVIGIRSAGREVGRISLLFLVLWAFTFTFGLAYEPRVWLMFVPYLVLVVPRLPLSAEAAQSTRLKEVQ